MDITSHLISIESEKGLLGSILTNPKKTLKLCTSKELCSEAFYEPKHKLLYESLVAMSRFEIPIDMISIGEHLKKSGALKSMGGYEFVEDLINSTPTDAHAEYYINFIQLKFAMRQYMKMGNEILDKCKDPNTEPDSLASYVTTTKTQISKMMNADQLKVDDIGVSANRLISRMRIKAPVMRKIKSSINTLRNRIVGYPVGRMTVIGARPGVGKTALVCSETEFFGSQNIKTSVLTFEMSADEYVARMASIRSGVGLEDYIDGKLSELEIKLMSEALADISKMPIRIAEKAMNIDQVVDWISEEKDHSSVIIIDHFLLIKHRSKKGERDSSIYSEWAHRLRDAAKTFDVALIVLSQLHRFIPKDRSGNSLPPSKDNLKETGSLEEDAYLLLLIHNQPIKDVSNYQLIVDKHRNGWSGIVPVTFTPKTARISGLGE